MLSNKSLLLFDNLCTKFAKGKVFYNKKRQDIGSNFCVGSNTFGKNFEIKLPHFYN